MHRQDHGGTQPLDDAAHAVGAQRQSAINRHHQNVQPSDFAVMRVRQFMMQVAEMGDAFPELNRALPVIEATVRGEEERFQRTLGRGLTLLEDAIAGLPDGAALPGETAFKLYDTYGFPLDLTQDALRAKGLSVDEAGFNTAMERQRADARAHWQGSGDVAADSVWFGVRDVTGPTQFLGYSELSAKGAVKAIIAEGSLQDALPDGARGELVFDRTPFYAESGGQIGDTGEIRFAGGARFVVEDVKKRAGDVFAHIGVVKGGSIRTGDEAELLVDTQRRDRTRSNHSATHLMHSALRNVLGPHVSQKGSYVGPARLRFDFSHGRALTASDIAAIEAEVNAVVRQNDETETSESTPDEAIAKGALALFGEKYGDKVRVLTIGQAPGEPDKAYSVELCGGTHVRRTGDIALFKIVGESAVSAGVRRVEALTGEAAREYLEQQASVAKAAADTLKVPVSELEKRLVLVESDTASRSTQRHRILRKLVFVLPDDIPGVPLNRLYDVLRADQIHHAVVDERRRLEKELSDAKTKLAMGGGGGAAPAAVETIGNLKFTGRIVEGVGGKELRSLVDAARAEMGSGIAAFVGINDGKAAIAVGVTDDLAGSAADAVALVRAGSEAMGGKGGGGRPDFAQAGGPDADKGEEALAAIRAVIAGKG